ncbi:peptidylprolyl isomerase [Anaeromyxobacter paludicola]|uniref:Peptidylprolyl isomerase n=1 Tax=Anaeromyxobacter paludicola TaxID=2918171 RepID=A0ABN6NBN0_9BACT|nr:peptidylprolyl isomerase [Anaeromyxobacter paludicola]BDG09693.1 peptidylprolyl isomerase [Anaeromyxobacter paludicola]
MTSLLLAAFLAAAPAASTAPGRVIDRVAAVVNGEVVTLGELIDRLGPQYRELEKETGPEAEKERTRALRLAFDRVVSERLFDAQATALQLEVTDAEVDGAIADIKTRNKLDEAGLDRALAEQGLSRDAFRKAVKRDLESMRLMQVKVRSKVKVTDEDLQAYYQSHLAQFTAGEEVRVRHIFLALDPAAPKSEEGKVEARAEAALKRVRGGADFAQVAREVSQGPSAAEGGELGWLKRGMVQPDLEKAAFRMKKGEISPVLRTQLGFQIIQVEDLRGGGPRPFADVKEEIRDRLTNEQLESYRNQYVSELRKDAIIEVKMPELADLGSAAGQAPATAPASAVEKKP